MLIIGDHNWQQHVAPQVIDGERKAKGYVRRNLMTHPIDSYEHVKAVQIDLVQRSEWPDRIKDKVAAGSQVSDVMRAKKVPCLDQNGKGFCWAHSTTGCVQAVRALMNEATVGLSAYAVACVIKNFRDEGGWGAESAEFISKRGVPSEEFWPQRSMSRSNDTDKTWANAALHRITEGWWDLDAAQYDRRLSFDQVISLHLGDVPTVDDFNWWSHSVMGCDAVNGESYRGETRAESGKLATLAEFELIWGMNDPVTAGFGIRDRNSWGSSYGDDGFFVLTGSKAIPDGGVAPRVVTAAAA